MAGALDGVPFWAQKTTRVTGTGGDEGHVCGDGCGMPGGKGRGSRKQNSAAALRCLPRCPRHRTEKGGGRETEGNAIGALPNQPQGGGVGVWWWWGGNCLSAKRRGGARSQPALNGSRQPSRRGRATASAGPPRAAALCAGRREVLDGATRVKSVAVGRASAVAQQLHGSAQTPGRATWAKAGAAGCSGAARAASHIIGAHPVNPGTQAALATAAPWPLQGATRNSEAASLPRGGGRDGATAPLSHAGGAAAARTARLRLSLALAAWDGAAAPLPHAGGAAAEGSARMRLSTALAALDGAVAPLPRAGGAAAARRGGGRNGAAALPGGAADGAAAPLPRAGGVGRRGGASSSRWRCGSVRDGAAAPLSRAGGVGQDGRLRVGRCRGGRRSGGGWCRSGGWQSGGGQRSEGQRGRWFHNSRQRGSLWLGGR